MFKRFVDSFLRNLCGKRHVALSCAPIVRLDYLTLLFGSFDSIIRPDYSIRFLDSAYYSTKAIIIEHHASKHKKQQDDGPSHNHIPVQQKTRQNFKNPALYPRNEGTDVADIDAKEAHSNHVAHIKSPLYNVVRL